MKGSLDWDDLRFFLGAVRARTMAGAARALSVEHSTVSRRLGALERTLGAPLVVRAPEGVRLTPIGEKLVPLVEEVERAVHAALGLVASERSRVRLAVPTGFTKLFTARFTELRREHPELTLELLSSSRRADLGKGEADLALRVGKITDENLVAKKLGQVGFSLYASEAYLSRRGAPPDPRQLAGHELVGYDPALAHTPGAQWIEKHGAGATIVLRNREMTDMIAAAVAGVGLAVLPCMLAATEPALRRLTPELLGHHTLSVVYRREMLAAEPIRVVIRFVTRVIQENTALLGGQPSDSTSAATRRP